MAIALTLGNLMAVVIEKCLQDDKKKVSLATEVWWYTDLKELDKKIHMDTGKFPIGACFGLMLVIC
jgi:hypothetical protein